MNIKKTYETPELEFHPFAKQDIICASPCSNNCNPDVCESDSCESYDLGEE